MLQSRAAQVAVAPALLANIYSTARKLEPTYHHLYYNLAWHYLNCWNGAPGDLEKFAMQAHKDTQDISGFNIYAMIAMHLLRGSNIKRFAHFNLDWSILRPQIVDLIAKHPRSQENLIYFLWFACRWQDRELAREIINRLDHLSKKWPQLSMPLWLGEQNYLAWRKWAVTDGPPPKN